MPGSEVRVINKVPTSSWSINIVEPLSRDKISVNTTKITNILYYKWSSYLINMIATTSV